MSRPHEDGANAALRESAVVEQRERGVVAAALALLGLGWLVVSWPWGPAPAPVPAADQLHGAARLLLGEPLDLNDAPAESLEALPGIGPGRAAAIVEERARRPFASVAELQRVRGIGPRTLARLEGLVRASPAHDARADAG